jgi:hypothetical protein
MFENGVLRKIFGLKDDRVGGWRKYGNGGLYELYWSLNIIRDFKFEQDEMGGECST